MSGNKDESIPAWSCGECADRLVTSSKRGECVWSLSPSSAFLKGLGCQSPQISLKVDFVRPFNYDLKLGWLWHKSWNIPSITVALETRDGSKLLRAGVPMAAQVFAVKRVRDEDGSLSLVDLGLKGITCQNLRNGLAQFSALKFLTTSYYHDGQPFHLLFSVFQRSLKDPDELHFVASKLSPAFTVDSRRLARDTTVCKDKLNRSAREYFPIEVLGTTFYKRQTSNNRIEEIKVDSDFAGLHNYFTARNIRCKVRHPVFLALKFPDCVKLYYNTKLVRAENWSYNSR